MSLAYSPAWRMHFLQERLLPGLIATAKRHAPILEEWRGPGLEVDLGAGRAIVIPAQAPIVKGTFCALCSANGFYLDPSPLGWIRVVCPTCSGTGFEPAQ